MRDDGSRGNVLQFRGRGAPAPAAPRNPDEVDPARERVLNAEWDRLLELTVQACTWRDPESLAAVELVLARLVREATREWSS
jgi:hypothetical protein